MYNVASLKLCLVSVLCVFNEFVNHGGRRGYTSQHRHSTNGDIQWVQVKPWMCSIKRCGGGGGGGGGDGCSGRGYSGKGV